MNSLPPLRAIQVFEAVGRCGSVTAAADELSISPGAVTQQIHVLERTLNLRLVRREGRGIGLTRLGRAYLPHVVAAFELLQKAGRDIDRARRSSHLAISALPSVANRWLGPLLFKWKELHPTSSIHLEGADQEPRLEDAEVDFRISYGGRHRLHPRHIELFTDVVIPVGSPSLLRGKRGPISPRDLLEFTLLAIDWGPEHAAPPSWHDWFASFAVSCSRVRCGLSFSLSSAALDAATEGRGLVLAQHSMVADALTTGRLVRLSDHSLPLPEPYFLAWSDSAIDKAMGSTFFSWLISESKRFDLRNSIDLSCQSRAGPTTDPSRRF
jgi:LysR family transcriptional regulator, glycine cleavage system transcriptional activator